MEDLYSVPSGPQLYLLSEEGYEELKSIQSMLRLMAYITYHEEDDGGGPAMLMISRAELYVIFQAISVQIGNALERLAHENGVGTPSRIWQ